MNEQAIPFGERRGDGRIVTASEVPRGDACDCICPECGGSLQAHHGAVLRWHFQHKADAIACGGGAESALHKFAKQIIADKQALYLPPLQASFGNHTRTVQRGRWVKLSNVRLEERVGAIIPDIIATTATRSANRSVQHSDLLIEIVVTHRADENKRRFIEKWKLPAIEIYLSGILTRHQPTLYDCTADILRDAPREWLWHAEQRAANLWLAQEISREEIQKRELAEWRTRSLRRNAEHQRYRYELVRRRDDLQAEIIRRNEISHYQTMEAIDVEAKRREKDKWLSETARLFTDKGEKLAAKEIVEWNRTWRERI